MSVGPAGAPDRRLGRRGLALRLSSLLVVAALAACAGEERRPPARLMDGSPAREPPVELEGIEKPALLTSLRVRDVAELPRRSSSASCLRQGRWGLRPDGASVERVGVTATSVTFREGSGHGVFGCDSGLGAREAGRPWCGRAFGLLRLGRLRDPRLDIGCSTDTDKPIALTWVEPGARTRYVVVAEPAYSEVYVAATGLPVRVATTKNVDLERSAATFDVSEHDASGRLLRTYELEAVVAG